jgi:hypothetical protein
LRGWNKIKQREVKLISELENFISKRSAFAFYLILPIFFKTNKIVINLFAECGSASLNQDLDTRPGLVDNSLDPAGRDVESVRSTARQLEGIGVGHHADAVREVVAGSIGVV